MRICGSGRVCTPPHRASAETEQICAEAKSFGVRVPLPLGGASRAPVRHCRTWHRRKTGEFAGRSPHPLLPTASKNSNKEVQLTNRNSAKNFRMNCASYTACLCCRLSLRTRARGCPGGSIGQRRRDRASNFS